MKKHNFNAGPSILPREVIEKTAQAVLDFNGSGLSIMEISHRAKDFQPVVDEAVALFKELLNIPEGYSVLFLGGGASLEFCMIPFNFLEKKAAYLNTGVWAKKWHLPLKRPIPIFPKIIRFPLMQIISTSQLITQSMEQNFMKTWILRFL